MKPAHDLHSTNQTTDKWNESEYMCVCDISLSKPPRSCIGYLLTHIIRQLQIEIVKGLRGHYSSQERESCWIYR